MLELMAEPQFYYDPITLREVADDPEEARTFADAVLAHYRSSSDNPREQSNIAGVLVRWLRISGQHTRAEEVARTMFKRAGGSAFLDAVEQEDPAELDIELVRPALRLATALQWNSDADPNKSVLAANIFEYAVDAPLHHMWSSEKPDPEMLELYGAGLRHRAKFRLEAEDRFGALRDANLALSIRQNLSSTSEQLRSAQEIVEAILQLIETEIERQVNAAGASITTETFAAGDRSGYGAVSAGKRIGPWLFWMKNGRVKSAGEYVDDQLHGPWIWFREQGGLLQEGAFIGNLQEGHWVRYHPNGRILDQGEFHQGNKIGKWEAYNEDGSAKKVQTHKFKRRSRTSESELRRK